MAGGLAQIGEERAGGGIGSGAPARELNGAGEVADQADRVENPVHRSHGVASGNQGGGHPDLDPVGTHGANDRQQLDHVA